MLSIARAAEGHFFLKQDRNRLLCIRFEHDFTCFTL
jgi:hypothetical protein